MTHLDPLTLWTVIIGLAIGSFALRFLFIGLVGSRAMPAWLMRHLRYTAVAVIPALVAPLVIWPTPTNGQFSTPHLAVACVTFAIGYWTKNVLMAGAVGAGLLIVVQMTLM